MSAPRCSEGVPRHAWESGGLDIRDHEGHEELVILRHCHLCGARQWAVYQGVSVRRAQHGAWKVDR